MGSKRGFEGWRENVTETPSRPPGIREKDTRVDATRVDSELFDRRPQRPPTTRSDRHNLPAAARPATRFARALCSCVTATMVKQRMRGKVAVGKRAATEKASPPDDASDVVEKVCPPLGRRCREIPRVVGVPSSRRSSHPRESLARLSTRSPLASLSLHPCTLLAARCPPATSLLISTGTSAFILR